MSFRCGSCCVALISFGSLGSSNAIADTISTWNGGSGNWSTAGQWTPSRVPNNTASQSYDVTIGSNGTATLDISPTIDTLTLNGVLGEGFAGGPLNDGFTTLTVNGNATINGGFGGNYADGWRGSLIVGGNLTNNGYMDMGSTVSIAGNMKNPGAVTLIANPAGRGFSVGGTLVNTGNLQWGVAIGDEYGPPTSLGGLVNKGSIAILYGSVVSVTGPTGVTDIPKEASWFISGSFSGFAHLTGIEGSLDIEGTNEEGSFFPLILGSQGNTIHNSSPITIGSTYGPSEVDVIGNLSNTGNIAIAYPGLAVPGPQFGPSTLNVSGTLTNQAAGTLSVNLPVLLAFPPPAPSPGALNAGNLVNYGTATFSAGTASTANFFENNGTVNIYGGSLTVGTLKTAGGQITVWNPGGLLTVGSGAAPAGFAGYYQLSNGVLDAAGGELEVQNPIDLNGTLDIMLGDGYKPVGTVFTVLWNGGQGVTGTFSNVEGSGFDDGREKYVLSYFGDSGDGVYLTVENNAAPEPGSVFLVLLGAAGLLGTAAGTRRRMVAWMK